MPQPAYGMMALLTHEEHVKFWPYRFIAVFMRQTETPAFLYSECSLELTL